MSNFMDKDNRIFYLNGEIEGGNCGGLYFDLLTLIELDKIKYKKINNYQAKPIHLYINSPGGDVNESWSLIDLILSSQTPIYTYATGQAMSAAFNIFVAGHKRFAFKHTVLMYHGLSSFTSGKYQAMETDIKYYKYLTTLCEEYILQQTKITKKQLENNRKEGIDWFIYAKDFKKLNICEII